MELTLKRTRFDKDFTMGELSINGKFFCYTCEDEVRKTKVPKETAIPPGRYEIVMNFSGTFKKKLPLLLNVKNFTGVRIHCGNTDDDTEGCILVGSTLKDNFVGNSRNTMKNLMAVIEKANTKEKVFITVS